MSQIPLVDVAAVTQGLVEDKILRAGDIVPETQVTIYSKVQGWVEKINVREGDRVKAGQVLVTLDAREAEATVAQAKASLEAATARLKQVKATSEETVQSQIQQTKANMELAEADLKRAQELQEKNFIARQQLDEARMKYSVAKAAYDLALNSIRQKTWENDIALAEAQMRQAKANLDLSQAQLANLIIQSPHERRGNQTLRGPGHHGQRYRSHPDLNGFERVKDGGQCHRERIRSPANRPAGKNNGVPLFPTEFSPAALR